MFRVLWLTIKDISDELFVLIGINFLYTIINAPLIGLGIFFLFNGATSGAAVLLLLSVLVLGPTNAGLYTAAQYVTEGRAIRVGVFFEGLRSMYALSWRIYGIWMAGLLLILINMRFYLGFGSSFGTVLAVLCFDLLVIWIGLLIYLGPLMLLQENKSIRMIARNAVLMTVGRPIFTLVTLILMTLITTLTFIVTVLPFLITWAFLAVWGFRATLKLVQDNEERRLGVGKQDAAVVAPKGRGGQIKPK